MKPFSELLSAFDYIDEIIYICDMETYDLLYCNRKTKELLLDAYEEDQPGYKCYKCLQGLDSPCVFCNNEDLKQNNRGIWTRKNPQTGKYYLLHDTILEFEGKKYRMELAVDASHMEEAALHTSQRLDMETHLTDCVRRLVQAGNFSDSVSAVLQTVLNYYGGERAYLFDFDWEQEVSSNTYEICAPGITPEIDNLQRVPLEHMRIWLKLFEEEGVVVIEDMELLRDNPARKLEYEDLSAQGIRSIIAVPIYTEEQLTGFVGVDNPKQNFGNKDFLVNLVYFLGTEIRRQHMMHELRSLSYHDPLTGVYNRKGLEQIVRSIPDGQRIGFAVIDIDNFKLINDTFGHSMGDEILKEAANMLVSVFRSEDSVMRLGGDEFAVLLYNCSEEAWKPICSKIRWIHTALAEKHRDLAVTLSVGVALSADGYSEALYRAADEALYETKRNGRAGCTMVDLSTEEKHFWKDDSLSSYSRTVLEFNSTGLYRVDYPLQNTEKKPGMTCSDVAREIFGFSEKMSPEECYAAWESGIDPSYRDALTQARQKLLQGLQTECTYQWNHPQYGKIFIRTNGTGELAEDVQVIYGYHHSLKDTKIIEREDENRLLLEALSSIYFGSYYVNLDRDTYYTIKSGPNEKVLRVQEDNAAASLQAFVNGLVRPDQREKMRDFVDLKTLDARMKNELHLDCEYVSLVGKNWCRATLIPVRYAADGHLTHVLFQVTPLDINNAQELDENAQNKKSIESLYNHVPGGLVLYEWNRKQLKPLQVSRYYEELYGTGQGTYERAVLGENEMNQIHPDDREAYRNAVLEALEESRSLEYVYRAWNRKSGRYDWVKLSAVSEAQPDGTLLVYAMYSDVTGQKEAELKLLKKQASLVAALGASNQLCYEYDPKTHIEECLTEDHVFHFPRIIENYPESLLNYVHPEDQQLFLDTIHSMDQGETEAECNIRLLRDGEYVWYAYQLHSFYDSEKERIIVILSIIDNSEHMATIETYRERMQMMMNMTKDTMSLGTVNVTKNSFSAVNVQSAMRVLTEKSGTLDELFQKTAGFVVGEKAQAQYRKMFSREGLLSAMEQGTMHVFLDHLYQIAPHRIEWVSTCVDMLKNPITGEVNGVAYSRSIQKERITNILLEKTLQRDYPMAAVVYADSDAYYLFDPVLGEYCIPHKNFWKSTERNLENVVEEERVEEVKREMTREKVFAELEENREYAFAFEGTLQGSRRRLEAKFSYLDDTKEMLLATIRDITDSVIMAQLRHDNERDHLTNLYNRRKIFEQCRILLEEHPEDQFAMLHFDIRHFRLYNTFFGDQAGDKLLCDIADMFRSMADDYEYWAYGRIESDVFCVFFPINHNKYQKHLHDLLHGLQDYRSDFLIEPAIGIYTVTDRKMSIESMFTRASIAAKTVRSGVTNSVIFYDEEMEQTMSDEQQVVNEMQIAIEEKQFQVYFQPKYSLLSNKPVGSEALVRWIHPQRGLISPAKFIPVFERNGFIATLDRYMWENVCILLKKWQDAGYSVAPVSVNVSRISMYSPTTVQFLKDLVTRYEIEPKYLELELTESAYMDDPEEIKKQLRELRRFGFRILMDDFGSGYSSLNTLRELPVDCLKLDMKFLTESETDMRGRLVLASVVRMSRLLNLTIIAEGVETTEQAQFLRGLGCEFVQGYLYARPMPTELFEQILPGMDPAHTEHKRSAADEAGTIIADTYSQHYSLGEIVPVPMAFLEYREGSAAYKRVNSAFLKEFEIDEDLAAVPDIFARHLSGEDLAGLMKAYADCAAGRKPAVCRFTWLTDRDEKRSYAGRITWEGNAEEMDMITAVFTDLTGLQM